MAKQTFTTGQVLLASQLTNLQQTAMLGGIASLKTVSYTLVAADAGSTVAMNSASSTTITVNQNLFSAGDILTIYNTNTGVSTITPGTATVTTSGSLALSQNQGGVLHFTSASAAIFFQFATPASSGDIEGVTAGIGISGGGTSGTVTITNSMATAIDAKGDLVAGTGADTFSRLAVGANDTILVADSNETTGLKWAAASSGAAVLVKRVAFSGVASTGTDFDGVFTSTYGTYIVSLEEAIAGTGGLTQNVEMVMRVSGSDQTGAYYGTSNGKIAAGAVAQTFYGTNNDTHFTLSENAYIYGTLQYNRARSFFSGFLADEITGGYCQIVMNYQSSPVDGFKLRCDSGNISGTVAVYGLAK